MQNANVVFEYILGAGVAIFPSLGFFYQYRLINASKSIGTFSINVCGVMFLSNFLRLAFFIYKEFSLALLFQTVLNIIIQILLLYLCVKTMNSQGYFQKSKSQAQVQSESWINHFWKWRKISNYIIFLGTQAFLIFYLGYITRVFAFQSAGQILGYAAMLAETFILLPQLIQNLKQKQVLGISYAFVTLNTLQDFLELTFVVIYSQPFQFIIFNFLQVLGNVLLILQIIYYKKCCTNIQKTESVNIGSQNHHFQQDLHVLNEQQITKTQTIKSSLKKSQSQKKSQLLIQKNKEQIYRFSQPICA